MSLRRWGLPAGLALIAIVNAVILGRVAWNRSGTPDRIVLTERELVLPYHEATDEDTGLELRLQAGAYNSLDEADLRRLGFDVVALRKSTDRTLQRTGFVVLEMEGDAWRRWLAEERKRKSTDTREGCSPQLAMDAVLLRQSRLFPVEAGTDADELRRRHPDRSRFLIVPVKVNAWTDADDGGKVKGSFHLQIPALHVPLELRPVIDQVLREDQPRRDKPWEPHGPRYKAVIATGPRHEPWLVSVERLAAPKAGASGIPPAQPPAGCFY